VVRIKVSRALWKSKKGQLFVIEAFIAVSVMILMVAAIYEVQLATYPPKEQKYDDLAYTILESLDKSGTLDDYISTLKRGTTSEIESFTASIRSTIYASLPDNGDFYFYCKNISSNQVIEDSIINSPSQKPSDTVAAEYLITEINGLHEPYLFHLSIWMVGV